MELLFNELSIDKPSPDKYSANEKMKLFSEVVAIARRAGFKNIRSHYSSYDIQLAEDYTLNNWLFDKSVPETYRNILFGMIVLPFINEDDEAIEEQYVESKFFFEDSESGIAKTECLGLTAAYLYETLSISLQSGLAWAKNSLVISVEANGGSRTELVKNIHSKECFGVASISDFIEQLGSLVLIETLIEPNDKKNHFADHHGQDDLKAHWKRLKNSPYVIECRSTDWGGKRYIRKFEKDGAIEIVLVDSSKKYALWVQTTGRNLRETKAISEILESKYN